MTLTLLTLNDIKHCITMKQAIDSMETAFQQLTKNQVELPLRTPIEIEKEDALMLTMPAYLSEDNALGLKVVSIFPNNLKKNKAAINGAIILLNADTGEVQAIMEAAYLTALRTGAVSGLATKYLATEDAEQVAILGSGVQALTQLEAVAAVRNIKRVSIWSRQKKNAEAFAKAIKTHYPEVVVYDSIPEAIKEADIICTATGSTSPLVHLADLKPQVHINAIGSHTAQMCEVAAEVMSKAVVVGDQLEAVLAESGEIINAINKKLLDAASIKELGTVILENKPDLKNQLTVFKSVGLAIQDISIAKTVYQNALKKKLGMSFKL